MSVLRGWEYRFCAPDDELLTGVCGDGEGLPVQNELAHERVPDLLDAAGLGCDVVRGPPSAEVRVLDGEFADEFTEARVVGRLCCLHAQECDAFGRDTFPVCIGLLESMVSKVGGVLDISCAELVEQFTELALATIERASVQQRD